MDVCSRRTYCFACAADERVGCSVTLYNPLDELANALAPKSPQSEYLIAPGMGMGGNSVSIGLGGGYSGG